MLGAPAVKRTAKFLDFELEAGDQRFRAGTLRYRPRGPCLRLDARGTLGLERGALSQDHRMSSGKIGR